MHVMQQLLPQSPELLQQEGRGSGWLLNCTPPPPSDVTEPVKEFHSSNWEFSFSILVWELLILVFPVVPLRCLNEPL